MNGPSTSKASKSAPPRRLLRESTQKKTSAFEKLRDCGRIMKSGGSFDPVQLSEEISVIRKNYPSLKQTCDRYLTLLKPKTIRKIRAGGAVGAIEAVDRSDTNEWASNQMRPPASIPKSIAAASGQWTVGSEHQPKKGRPPKLTSNNRSQTREGLNWNVSQPSTSTSHQQKTQQSLPRTKNKAAVSKYFNVTDDSSSPMPPTVKGKSGTLPNTVLVSPSVFAGVNLPRVYADFSIGRESLLPVQNSTRNSVTQPPLDVTSQSTADTGFVSQEMTDSLSQTAESSSVTPNKRFKFAELNQSTVHAFTQCSPVMVNHMGTNTTGTIDNRIPVSDHYLFDSYFVGRLADRLCTSEEYLRGVLMELVMEDYVGEFPYFDNSRNNTYLQLSQVDNFPDIHDDHELSQMSHVERSFREYGCDLSPIPNEMSDTYVDDFEDFQAMSRSRPVKNEPVSPTSTALEMYDFGDFDNLDELNDLDNSTIINLTDSTNETSGPSVISASTYCSFSEPQNSWIEDN